jgi:hypothetical protein
VTDDGYSDAEATVPIGSSIGGLSVKSFADIHPSGRAAQELVGAVFLGSACPALVLLLQHGWLPAQGTLPRVVPEEGIYLLLQKAPARQASHRGSALLAEHVHDPSIQARSFVSAKDLDLLNQIQENIREKHTCFSRICARNFTCPNANGPRWAKPGSDGSPVLRLKTGKSAVL